MINYEVVVHASWVALHISGGVITVNKFFTLMLYIRKGKIIGPTPSRETLGSTFIYLITCKFLYRLVPLFHIKVLKKLLLSIL